MSLENTTTTLGSHAMQLVTVTQILQRHGWQDGGTQNAKLCLCDHKLHGTGAIFFQSTGLILCSGCDGWQLIRKPVR